MGSPAAARNLASIYLSVLISSLIVAALAMSALVTSHCITRQRIKNSEERLVQLAASSGLDLAVAAINSSTNWRKDHTSGLDVQPVGLPGMQAEVTYRIVDPDGDLLNDLQQPCRLLVTARSANCSYRLESLLIPAGQPLTCCAYDLASHEKISTSLGSYWHIHSSFGTNASIEVWGDGLTGNAFRRRSGWEVNMHGERGAIAEDIKFPSRDVMDYYQQLATSIEYASLSSGLGTRVMKNGMLSASHNSFGVATNPRGIYSIDCKGQALEVSFCRLAATLLVRNASRLTVKGSVHWESPQANYPAILVEGNLDLKMSKDVLREVELPANLNPPNFPFRGQGDLDELDAYPSMVNGLVFATGSISTGGLGHDSRIFGPVFALGSMSGSGDLRVASNPWVVAAPPPGFRGFEKVAILTGTTRRVAIDWP